jgi:hypothetical protein
MFGGLNTIIVQKLGATTVAEPCHSDTVPVPTYYFRSYGSSSSFLNNFKKIYISYSGFFWNCMETGWF